MEGFEGDPYASCAPRQSKYSLSILPIIITQISFSIQNIQIEKEYKKYELNHLFVPENILTFCTIFYFI